MKLSEIPIRDPFVLPFQENGYYYLFGSTDNNIWSGPGMGFDCYQSRDLEDWEGPIPAFRARSGFWGTTQFWAPEVHFFNGRFFMFATFNPSRGYRGTQILASDKPEGPFEPWTDGPITPANWQCLDGTLHVDAKGTPWIVFCHEWVQVHNGAMYAMKLSSDLKHAVGPPIFLFSATEAPWVRPLDVSNEQETAGAERLRYQFPVYVTDGPFLHRNKDGSLLMLWSSFGAKGYAMGIAHSLSGTIQGCWTQHSEPIWAAGGGHGMLFRTFEGRLFLTLHQPNDSRHERAILRELTEDGASICLKP